jgi:TolB-like protein
VRGQEVDHRSDLFSLGVVIYELLTKQNPFRRDSEAATLKAVSDDNPQPAARYRVDLPDSLQPILDKALDKDVKTRYQHADDLKADLVRINRMLATGGSTVEKVFSAHRTMRIWWIVAAVVIVAGALTMIITKPWTSRTSADKPDKIMLAVLPFENLGDPEDEYFADGITEEITSRLAALKSLGVISRTSAYAYKGSQKTLPQIGKELGVAYILEGTLRWDRRGDSSRVLVTPQLIDVGQDAHLWADRYERRLTDIFAVQRDIAVQVVAALDLTLAGDDSSRIEPPMTKNMAAYEAFIKGKEGYRRLEWDVATEWLEKATQLDPRFAEAWAYLSIAQYRAMLSYMGKDSSIAQATLSAAETALSLNPHLAAGHLALGQYYYLRADYDRAASEYEKAVEEAPNDADALFQFGLIRRRQGRWAESSHILRQGLIIDPLNVLILGSYVETAKMAREASDARTLIDDLVRRFPENLNLRVANVIIRFHCEGPTPAVHEQLRECLRALPTSSLAPEERLGLIESLGEHGFQMRDTAAVRQVLAYFPRFNQPQMMGSYYMLAGELNFHRQQPIQARTYYDSARVAQEAWESGGSEQGRIVAREFLAWTLARLGESERAVNLLDWVASEARQQGDFFLANHNLLVRCRVYTAIGEVEKAIACLDTLMSGNGWVSPYELKYDMTWDPLRGEPGFEALIKKYENPDAI